MPPLTRLRNAEVFCVDATALQVTARGFAPHEPIRVRLRDLSNSDLANSKETSIATTTTHGAIAVLCPQLTPDTDYEVRVQGERSGIDARLGCRTRPALTGQTTKIAAMSDVHIGVASFGLRGGISESTDSMRRPYAERCFRAAVAEATEWGAELLVIKGDLTHEALRSQWRTVRDLLDEVIIPIVFTPGNHDVFHTADIPLEAAIAEAGFDTEDCAIGSRVLARSVGNLRVVLGDTSVSSQGSGRLDHLQGPLAEAVQGDGPSLVFVHHNIEQFSKATFFPPGIRANEASETINAIGDACENVWISSGHTHRNRAYRSRLHPGVFMSEVASTSDFPAVWSGYEANETTIRQTVWRIAEPSVLEWSERARRSVAGIWPRWAQGTLDDRCVDLALR